MNGRARKTDTNEGKDDDSLPDAWERFERAVDAALRTPAKHKTAAVKKKPKKTAKAKKALGVQ